MNYFDILFAKYKFEKDHPPIIKRTTGNPIVLTDAADAPLVECKTEIQGSQDLHGYDKPWVGGAGKNKCPNKAYKANSYTLYVGQDDNTSFPFALVGGTTYTLSFVSELSPILIYLREENTASGTLVNNTFTPSASGNYRIAISVDGIDTTNVSNIQLELGSSATDYEPYSNICPITAYTEGEIEVGGHEWGGINFMTPGEKKSVTINGVTVTSDGKGRYTIKGTATGGVNVFFDCDEYVVPDGTNNAHTFGLMNNASYPGNVVFYFYHNDTQVTDWGFTVNNRISSYAQMSNKTVNRYLISIIGGVSLNVEFSPMVCAGSTSAFPSTFSTYYKYYNHTTTYPSAIYRGSEDVVNGEVTTEWGMIASYAGETLPGEWISDRDEYAPGTTPTTGAQVAYELATPTTSSVTPTNLPIKSLSGYNHIESNTGDLDITYLTQNYQNFVDIIENNLGTRKKGGIKPLDVFRTLEVNKEPEEEEKKDEKVEDVKK